MKVMSFIYNLFVFDISIYIIKYMNKFMCFDILFLHALYLYYVFYYLIILITKV